MAIVVSHQGTLDADIAGENSSARRKYSIEGDNAGDDFDLAYQALIAAVPPGTPWKTVLAGGSFPFTWMYPTRAHLERKRPSVSQAVVTFEALGTDDDKGNFGVNFRFGTGSITVQTDKDQAGDPLPAISAVGIHMPALMFTLERIELASGWDSNSHGPASPTGSQRQRAAYMFGRVNSSNFMGHSGVNQEWMFAGADVQQWDYSPDYVKVAYHFAESNFRFGTDDVGWMVPDNNGDYHRVRDADSFQVLDLYWPDGINIVTGV